MILINKKIIPDKNFNWFVPLSQDDDECEIDDEQAITNKPFYVSIAAQKNHFA